MIDKLSNLFIVFFPDSGGNHLGNILSQSAPYVARCSPDNYNKSQLDAHYSSSMNNVNFKLIQANLEQLQQQSNVFCGHWLEIIQIKQQNLLEYFPNRKYCVIQIPSDPGRGYDVLFKSKLEPKLKEQSWVPYELRMLYTPKVVASTLEESTDTPFYGVSANTLYNDDVSLVLNQLQKQGLDIIIDTEVAQSMHTKWLENIKPRYQQ